ncbi:outer membrane beta-barrel protein [Flavobacterium psychroterrae]|uniref:Outer membrane beta-barrel protein n=1 Tax=Flavobacterium psychroterrae TaxID=2133767 RepID=A0ABS5PIH0_9FLAO|nr:outer membrane beta-barrel protein [Flavobacterium psychroterrae]MBS7234108.1 outer membrane beta-barrel protein [Flavobacterium psychroterrae]
MKVLLHLLIFCSFFNATHAQNETNITYGLKLGGIYSKISNLPESIKGRDNTFDNSVMESKGGYGIEGGFFLNCKLYDTRVAIQPELLFRQSSQTVNYHDTTGKEFELGLNYSYLQIGALYKVYPYEGLNLGFGAFYGISLSPNNITYKSNEAGGMYDVATRQFYQDGLDGADDFSLCFALGYELHESIHFDLRYYVGVKDVVKSNASSFQFIENQNKSGVFSFSLGYSFHQW